MKKTAVNAGPISDLSELPAVLLVHDMARVYRLASMTINKKIRAGTFFPLPFARDPYRWLKDDVRADLKRKRTAEPIRRKPIKASLNGAPAIQRQAQ